MKPLSFFFAVLCLPLPALAESPAVVTTPAGGLMQMLLGLGVTLAVLVAGLYLLKRLQGTRGNSVSMLNVLGARALGTREKVVLLGIGDKVLVLGVTPGRIQTLHTLDASELPARTAPAARPATDFAGRLRQFMEPRREN